MMILAVTMLLLGLCQSNLDFQTIEIVKGCPETCYCELIEDTYMLDEKLVVTNCSDVPITKLPDLLILHQGITELSITSSHLSDIPCMISNLTYLSGLYLQDNNIKEIPSECLIKLPYVFTLDLSSNSIEILRNETFYDFKSLATLNLSNNAITLIESDVFLQYKRILFLHTVDLSRNKLVSLDSWPSQYNYVLLNDNYISALTNQFGARKTPCRDLVFNYIGIDLSGNQIMHFRDIFDNWAFSYTSSGGLDKCMNNIEFGRNPYICDCTDYNLYAHIHQTPMIYFRGLTCDLPVNLRGKNIVSISLDQFICNITEKCDSGCTCSKVPFHRNIQISCPNHTELPNGVPSLPTNNFAYFLNFEQNNLKELSFKPYMWNTSVAKFSHGTLSKVTLDVLLALSKGSKLYLDHNQLQRLPHNLSNINFKGQAKLYLGGNPWVCDCEALETRDWIVMNLKVIPDIDQMVCHSPHYVKNKVMNTLDQVLFCPQQDMTKFIIIGLVTAVVALFVSTSVCFVYKRRTWIYQRTGWHPLNRDEAADEGKEFDVFVSYADEDE